MAKKQQRIHVGLQCGACKRQNYITERSKLNTPDKIKLSKHCPQCKKHTEHKEMARLH